MMVIVWLMMVNNNLVGAQPTLPKNDGVKVSWDYDLTNWMETLKFMFQTTNKIVFPVDDFKDDLQWISWWMNSKIMIYSGWFLDDIMDDVQEWYLETRNIIYMNLYDFYGCWWCS